MEGTLRKIAALCAKDFPDLIKNPVMIVTCLLPIVLVLIYRNFYGDIAASDASQQAAISYLLVMGACMTAAMVPGMIVLYSIAEEKEKNTLRTLMLANVSGTQILAAKTIVVLFVTAAVNAAIYYLLGADSEVLLLFIVIVLAGTLPVIFLSLVLGLLARDQMSSGLYSFPLMILALAPVFGPLVENEMVTALVKYSPCGGMVSLIDLLLQGQLYTSEALIPAAVTLAWIIAMGLAFTVFYRRFGWDT